MAKRRKKRVIFRRWRRDPRTGCMLDAWAYGYKAWPIPVEDERDSDN